MQQEGRNDANIWALDVCTNCRLRRAVQDLASDLRAALSPPDATAAAAKAESRIMIGRVAMRHARPSASARCAASAMVPNPAGLAPGGSPLWRSGVSLPPASAATAAPCGKAWRPPAPVRLGAPSPPPGLHCRGPALSVCRCHAVWRGASIEVMLPSKIYLLSPGTGTATATSPSHFSHPPDHA
jgi:hypothetical protein